MPCWIAQLSNLLLNLEITNEGTPAGLKAKAREKVSSPVKRRHQETGPEKGKNPLSLTNIHSLDHPANFTQEYITLFPEKIYLSIFLEPRKNNNILHKRHKYPTIPYVIVWDLLKKTPIFQQKLLRGSSFRKGQGHEEGSRKN